MFLMSYGYNPTTAKPIAYKAPPRVVDSILYTPSVNNDSEIRGDPEKSDIMNRKRYRPSKAAFAYITSVEHRISIINHDLINRKIPYRFKLRKPKKTFIDMEVLNEKGEVEKTHSIEVTEQNYISILEKIYSGGGFIYED